MIDRFKSRAKRCYDNRFVYGYLVFIYIDNPKKARIYCPDDTFSYDVYTDTLGQCTGLKDKNGRLIYEGDIVKRTFFNDRRKNKMKNCVIKWCNGRAVFTLDADMRDDYRSYEASCDNVFKECEVIGNIHENRELLK